jgi:hypothetical protein
LFFFGTPSESHVVSMDGLILPHLLMKLLSIPRLLIAVAMLALGSTSYSALIFDYRFDETGNQANNTGGAPNPLTLYSSSGVQGDLHGLPGSGIGGQPGNRAFKTSATRLGGAGSDPASGGVGVMQGGTAFDGLASFTIQGWFNASVVGGSAGRLVERFKSADSSLSQYISFTLSSREAEKDGTLSLQIGSVTAASTRSALLGQKDTWTFFAVTYDYNATAGTSTVNFYVGSEASAVSLLVSRTISTGIINSNDGTASIYFGNNATFTRPFAGLMDNIRLYGAADHSGALTLSELETLRKADMIPEPGAVALVALGAVALLRFRKR